MIKSIVEEIKKTKSFNTPKKIIISPSNFKKLKAEIGIDDGLDVSNLMVYGVEIQANYLMPDDEMIKIMHDTPQIQFPKLPVFNLTKEDAERISQILANAANESTKSIREFGLKLKQLSENIRKVNPCRPNQPKQKRKRRANFKSHMRRRLKRIHRCK